MGNRDIFNIVLLLAVTVFFVCLLALGTGGPDTPSRAFLAFQNAMEQHRYQDAWHFLNEDTKRKFDGGMEDGGRAFSGYAGNLMEDALYGRQLSSARVTGERKEGERVFLTVEYDNPDGSADSYEIPVSKKGERWMLSF